MGPSRSTRAFIGPLAYLQSSLFIFIYLNIITLQLVNGRNSKSESSTPTQPILTGTTQTPETNSIFRVSHNGTDCIRAIFKVNLTVEYACKRKHHDDRMGGHRTCRVDIGVPEPRHVIVDGRCGPEPILILKWSNSKLSLTFKFRSEDGHWFADHLEFSFDPKDEHFPNASEKKIKVFSAEKSLRLFRAPLGQSYFCNATEIVDLGLGDSRHAGVELCESQVQVFRLPSTTNFDTAHECPADSERPRSPITAFVIASCLALLVIVIIAGYYISRRTNPSPYATVD